MFFKDCLYFLRIKDWIYIIGLSLLGFVYGIKQFELFSLLILGIISSLYLAHGYTLNNCFDVLRLKKTPSISFRKGLVISYSLFVISCIIAFFYSKEILFLIVIGSIVGFLYVGPPFRLKRILAANFILNSLGFAILFMIGFLLNKTLATDMWLLAFYVFLAIIPAQIIHLISHRREERIWRCGQKFSLCCFNLSLIVFTIWSFVIVYWFEITYVLFLVTLIFSIIQFYTVKIGIKRKVDFKKIRLKLRIVNIIFGIGILCIFLFLS